VVIAFNMVTLLERVVFSLSKRQEILREIVAGANPWSTRSGKLTSAASSRGALVRQDSLKTTRKGITMLIQSYTSLHSPGDALIGQKIEFIYSSLLQ
jgi:hypothetical protein